MSSFDSFTLAAVFKELQQAKGAYIEQIYQPTKTELIINLQQLSRHKKLLLSIHPSFARLHYTQRRFKNPEQPSPFCMLLRKHLKGGRIESLEQEGLERIFYLKVINLDQNGLYSVKTLVAELMGRHSNLILTDGEPHCRPVILGTIRIVTPEMSRFRTVMPGEAYLPPPAQQKMNPLEISFEEFKAITASAQVKGQNITNTLVSNLQGISPSIARELVCGTENSLIKIWQKLQKLICSFNAGQWEPTALLDKNKKITAFLPVKLSMSPYSNWKRIRFREMSLLLDRYFLEREETENKQQLLEQLRNKVNRILTRSQKKERQQQIEYQSALNADRYRLWGDILLANLSQIPKGAKEITLPNFYREGEKVTIPLDPSSSAAANAQRYFRKYRKSKNSHAKIMAQLNQTKNEINYLESVLYNLEHANLQELQEIQEELERCGYIKKQRGKEKKQLSSSSSPLRFLSSEGYEILVGKNNRQNELLTFKLASKHDIWLHVKDQPGSHVIIKGKNPPAKTLHEGALLAAFYSKAADSANVPVDYTEVRHLRKPPGGKPGMVIYKNHHTLFVTPKTEIIKKLQALSNNIINPPQ